MTKKLILAAALILSAGAARASTYIPVLMSTAASPAVQAGSSTYSFHVASGTADNLNSSTFTATRATMTSAIASTVTVNGNTIQATAGTRTYTLPDAGANASIIQSTGTQTLSNKTLDNATLSNNLNANGQKLVSVATGTATGDAANIGQLAFINVSSATRIQTVATSSATTSTTFVATTYTMTYKMNSATDKVMGFVSIPTQISGTSVGNSGFLSYTRDGVDQTSGGGGFILTALAVSGVVNNSMMSGFFIDSPGDTNFHTYALTFKVGNASDTLTLNVSNTQGQYMLTEIRPNP